MIPNTFSQKLKTILPVVLGLTALTLQASSHREAPLITYSPKVDGTDLYAFRSYEAGRSNFVTLIANYYPDQSPQGGPNFFMMDTNALYEIHIDNNGDATEDITFLFEFSHEFKKLALPIGPANNQLTNPVPLINIGQISAGNTAALNVVEKYTASIIRGPRRTGARAAITQVGTGTALLTKPVDNIGNKSIPDYTNYANSYIYSVDIPGCSTPGRLFVGQRKDPFVVNLGETFDLVNLNPVGPATLEKDSLAGKNVTSLILEIPIECLITGPTNPVIGIWTTASKVVPGVSTNQVSRLGQPLVNELVIGLSDKDLFNSAHPTMDGALAGYVTHPTLPALLEVLFGVTAPTNFPRTDLVSVFLTGIAGLNQTTATAELLRLNTSTPAVARDQQNNLGVIAGDTAGFPNGRRLGDDVVDIALRVMMGKLLSTNDAPAGQLPYTDGAYVDATRFPSTFPYVREPLPGSPNDFSVLVTLLSSTNVNGTFAPTAAFYDANQQKLVAPKTSINQMFYTLQADGPVAFDGRRIETTPNVQLGIQRQ